MNNIRGFSTVQLTVDLTADLFIGGYTAATKLSTAGLSFSAASANRSS